MSELANKLQLVEKQIATEKGRFNIFALFLREGAQDLWDVIVAAPWVVEDKKKALHYIVDKLRSSLSKEEMSSLSRIIIIEPQNPVLDAFQRAICIEHGMADISDSIFFGLKIKHAYVITSRHDDRQADKDK